MEEKHHRLDEEELSECSWQQECLLVVLVDIEGETAASHGTARTAQQRYSKKAKDDAAVDHKGKMVAAIMLTERQREGMKVMAIGTERHREEERHGEKKEMVRGGEKKGQLLQMTEQSGQQQQQCPLWQRGTHINRDDEAGCNTEEGMMKLVLGDPGSLVLIVCFAR